MHAVRLAFAHSTQTVVYVLAGVMALTFLIALVWLPRSSIGEPAYSQPPTGDTVAAGAAAK